MALLLFILLLAGTAVVGTGRLWARNRRLRWQLVVQTLSSIVSRNLPLVKTLQAAAESETGRLRAIYGGLAYRLALGEEVSTAIRTVLPNCPGDVVGAVRAGERGGTLPAALQSLARDAREEAVQSPAAYQGIVYMLLFIAAIPPLLAYLMVFIAPKFKDIFAEYGISLPPPTAAFVQPGLLQLAAAVLLLLCIAVVLFAVQSVIARQFMPRVPGRTQFLYVLLDTVTWHLPVVRRIVRNGALARQLPLLQAGVRAGHDLPDAAAQAAEVCVNWFAQRSMRDWSEAMRSGTDAVDAARRAGMPSPVRRALAGASNPEELAARLAYLSAYYRSLHSHWERVVLSMSAPLIVVFWGSVVTVIVLGFFMPLVALTEMAVESVY